MNEDIDVRRPDHNGFAYVPYESYPRPRAQEWERDNEPTATMPDPWTMF